MGDWFQSIVDVEASEAEARGLADRVVGWLIVEGIVVDQRTDCTLGDSGHAPGSNYPAAVVEPWDGLLTTRPNGMEVEIGRRVFHPGQGGTDRATCPFCLKVNVLQEERTYELTPRWEDFSDAISSWYEGGTGELRCTDCQRIVTLNEWRWEPPWAFGFLGFTFWNWPQLLDTFVADVSRILKHRVVVTGGKL